MDSKYNIGTGGRMKTFKEFLGEEEKKEKKPGLARRVARSAGRKLKGAAKVGGALAVAHAVSTARKRSDS